MKNYTNETLYNLKVELDLIGYISTSNDKPSLMAKIFDFLDKKDFYEPNYRKVFSVLSRAYYSDGSFELQVIAQKLGNLKSVIQDAISGLPIIVDWKKLAMLLKDLRARREMGDALVSGAMLLEDSEVELEDIVKSIDIARFESGKIANSGITDIIPTLEEFLEDIEKNTQDGFGCGVSAIDKRFGTCKKGSLAILSARSGTGKTLLSIQYGLNAIREGKKVLFISLEMPKTQIRVKLFSHIFSVDSSCFMKADNDSLVEFNKVVKGISKVEKLKDLMFISESPDRHIAKIERMIERAVSDYGVEFVAIDFIQLLTAGKEKKHQDLGDVVVRLKHLAVKLNIAILSIAQFNRTAESGNLSASQLKDSGSIEEIADFVLALRHKYKTTNEESDLNKMDVYCLKNRWGTTGKATIFCNLKYGHFANLPNEK